MHKHPVERMMRDAETEIGDCPGDDQRRGITRSLFHDLDGATEYLHQICGHT
jgi:hypothetical protein